MRGWSVTGQRCCCRSRKGCVGQPCRGWSVTGQLEGVAAVVVVVLVSTLGKLDNLQIKKMLEKYEKFKFQKLLTYLSE